MSLFFKKKNARNPAKRNPPIAEKAKSKTIDFSFSIFPNLGTIQVIDKEKKKEEDRKEKRAGKLTRPKNAPSRPQKVAYSKPRIKNMTPKNCFMFIC